MLRDKNLVPLSRQHQHALALCVRLDRGLQAGEVDLEAWQSEMQQIFEGEIAIHFAAEERELFPAAARFSELQPLTQELINEHTVLRDFFTRASDRELNSTALQSFAETLATHIRKEERQLFEGMQKLMSADDLAALGAKLDAALADVSQACIIPSEATRVRANQS
jgi:hemerythrin-like domain-containing protein